MLPDLLVQIFTRHAVYGEGLKTQTVNDFAPFLKQIQINLTAELAGIDDLNSFKGRKLGRLLTTICKSVDASFLDYEKVWRQSLAELAQYESEFAIKAFGQVAAVDLSTPAPAQIMSAAFAQPLQVKGIDGGNLLQTFYTNWTDKTKQRVTGAVRLGVAQGATIEQLVRTIKGTKRANYRDGLLDVTRRDVNMMVRTSVAHVTNQSRAAVYQQNADTVVGEEILSVLDGRTSELCRALSGRRYEVGKGPQPPLHMMCRSMRVPVLDDGLDFLDGAGKQFARGAKGVEKVGADLHYYDWLKTQPQGFQDDVLGATRGQLFRKGGLSAKRFAQLQLDKNFRPRTLVEIKRIETEAFDKAELSTGSKLGNLVQKDLKTLYSRAKDAKDEVNKLAKGVAKEYKGTVLAVPLKGEVRAFQKIINDYGGDVRSISDIVRNTIVVDTKQVAKVAEQLEQKGAKVKVVNPKTDIFGYSGVNAKVTTRGGFKGEIQVNSPDMIFAKEPSNISKNILGSKLYAQMVDRYGDIGGRGHILYEKGRSLTEGSGEWLKVIARSREYYRGFW